MSPTLRLRISVRAYYISKNTGADHLTAWFEAERIEIALAAPAATIDQDIRAQAKAALAAGNKHLIAKYRDAGYLLPDELEAAAKAKRSAAAKQAAATRKANREAAAPAKGRRSRKTTPEAAVALH
jgi:hypothetical protein